MAALLILALIAGGITWWGLRRWQQRQRRTRLLASPLTEHQRRILHDQVPLIRKLPTHLQAPLEGKINLFLDQVDMHGCAGLDVTEDMQLSIAGQACLLIVNSPAWYDTLRTILIYPGAFKSKMASHDGFVVKEEEVVRLGESWARGPVILSWAASTEGALNDGDGENVVLHEFAHQLDALSGSVDGAPLLSPRQSFAEWERVVLDAFDRHQYRVERNKPTLLHPYGAENHQEFLAVAIEAFFEMPHDLRADEPELYAQLALLLDLDPANWQA